MSTFSEERSNDCYQPLGSFFVSSLIIHLLRKKSRFKSHYITFLSSQPMITRVDKKNFGCVCGVDKNLLPQAEVAGALRNVEAR